jgi:hypothetical protein
MCGGAAARSTWSTGTGYLLCRPIFIPQGLTFQAIGVCVSTEGITDSFVRIGIYDSDSKGRPQNLILDAGVVGATSTGVKTIAINQYLSANKYYLAAVGQTNGCTLVADSYINFYNHTDFPIEDMNTFEMDSITGALPNTWNDYSVFRTSAPRVLLKA